MRQVFDGHNDALSRLWGAGGDPVARFRRAEGQVNAPGARAGGFAGGFFALFSPERRAAFDFAAFRGDAGAMPPPNPIAQGPALASVMAQVGIARQLHEAGLLVLCTTVAQIEAAMGRGQVAALLHLEGAECLDGDLLVLDALYASGLRSLGPVWSRPTLWGEGVPFAYGRDGDTGPGLTADGRRLVARCAALGMVVDTSHLNAKGFWDIAEMGVPLVATHSNAWDLCATTRNLTRAQLKTIGETGGMVGLNYAAMFLSPEGWSTGRARVDDCLRQLDAMIDVAGEDHVGLGSDFDGAPMPEGLGSVAALPNLIAAMERQGFGAVLIDKICRENWLALLGRTLHG
ncbi:MAG: membrane dipeptidase [Rhodobacter sp.]|nr:membrane dipeptidase [Paracoccaceae bacterium]MCC0076263.1 membrane dipeptidase [Rhodobacter sp.]